MIDKLGKENNEVEKREASTIRIEPQTLDPESSDILW